MVSTVVVADRNQPSRRKSFSVKDKREFILIIDSIVSTGISRSQACRHIGFSPMYYTRFKEVIDKVDALENGATFVAYKTNGTARKIHPGPTSVLHVIKEDLSRFVFETRQRGIQVSRRMIRQEACRLLPNFKDKSIVAKDSAVLRFTKSMGLSNRAATHTAQKHFQETEEESKHFIEFMKAKLAGKDPCDVINMDQTPIPYSFHSNKTLENKGARTIHVRASTTDTKRVTLAVTIEASGRMLPPLLVFKGAANGRIAKSELPTYPDSGHYLCQPKAWMDEQAMIKWIDLVLVPWKNAKPPGVVPTLILDAYRVHMMGNIVNQIQSLGIEVVHIPAGCTYLCQPVDVGINKTIKCGIRDKWEDWMIEGEGIVDGAAKEPSRRLVAEWVLDVYNNFPNQIARNAWMKKGYEWF